MSDTTIHLCIEATSLADLKAKLETALHSTYEPAPAAQPNGTTDPYEHLRDAIGDGKAIDFQTRHGGSTWRRYEWTNTDHTFKFPAARYRVVEES